MNGRCALCNKEADLKESHVIPKFVFNWLKETGGALREQNSPNVRVQDGLKLQLLCCECEELFSEWEKQFSENIFLPFHQDKNIVALAYKDWALKFAVSISWRVLYYNYRLHNLDHFSDSQKSKALEALDVWRAFLLGTLPNPGQFEQHIVVVDVIESYSGPKISPYLNRYLSRSIHADTVCSNKSAMVYTKMGRLALFGFIQENQNHWKGTKIHLHSGFVGANKVRIPENVAEYWNYKADEVANRFSTISQKQKQKIHQAIVNNADKLVTSDVFRAIRHDVYHSGRSAFEIIDPVREKLKGIE